MKILAEVEYLKQRFDLDDLQLIFDDQFVNADSPAMFGSDNTIRMIDKEFEPNDILTLLHEIGHAVQFHEKRLINDNSRIQYFAKEIEAEMFAVYWGEVIYGIRLQVWRLGDYEDYLQAGGFTKVRRETNTPAGVFMRRYKKRINLKTLENMHKLHELTDALRETPPDKWSCERGTPMIVLN